MKRIFTVASLLLALPACAQADNENAWRKAATTQIIENTKAAEGTSGKIRHYTAEGLPASEVEEAAITAKRKEAETVLENNLILKRHTEVEAILEKGIKVQRAKNEETQHRAWETRMTTTMQAWQFCLLDEIKAIDDGVSTASDIATAVESACKIEYAAISNELPIKMKIAVNEDRLKATRDAAIPLVLRFRASKNRAKQSQ